MNKKGLMAVEAVFISIMVVGSLVTLCTPSIKDDFRHKKAVKMCEETGAKDCDVMVDSWSKADILSYIKDDEVATPKLNGGYFVGGYQN